MRRARSETGVLTVVLTEDQGSMDRALKLAAVLVPVVDYENEPKILLTRRADHLAHIQGRWRFPAARLRPKMVARCPPPCARRKKRSGWPPNMSMLRVLSTYETGSGFRILPVVGFVRPGFQLEIDHNEVAETFEVPLELMINEANYNRHEIEWEGRMEAYYAVEYEGYNIWGATAGMLRNLSRRMQT